MLSQSFDAYDEQHSYVNANDPVPIRCFVMRRPQWPSVDNQSTHNCVSTILLTIVLSISLFRALPSIEPNFVLPMHDHGRQLELMAPSTTIYATPFVHRELAAE